MMNETTMPRAEVAVETIYAIFDNKRATLSHLVDVLVVGDDELIPLITCLEIPITKQKPDQRQQIRIFARWMWEVMTQMATVSDIMRTVARGKLNHPP